MNFQAGYFETDPYLDASSYGLTNYTNPKYDWENDNTSDNSMDEEVEVVTTPSRFAEF